MVEEIINQLTSCSDEELKLIAREAYVIRKNRRNEKIEELKKMKAWKELKKMGVDICFNDDEQF